jgi:hypothetical protein
MKKNREEQEKEGGMILPYYLLFFHWRFTSYFSHFDRRLSLLTSSFTLIHS